MTTVLAFCTGETAGRMRLCLLYHITRHIPSLSLHHSALYFDSAFVATSCTRTVRNCFRGCASIVNRLCRHRCRPTALSCFICSVQLPAGGRGGQGRSGAFSGGYWHGPELPSQVVPIRPAPGAEDMAAGMAQSCRVPRFCWQPCCPCSLRCINCGLPLDIKALP